MSLSLIYGRISMGGMGAFQEVLLAFLQEELCVRKAAEGWDERFDPDLARYRDRLSCAIRSAGPYSLEDILQSRRFLFDVRGPVHLERRLLDAFSQKEKEVLKAPFPAMYRGLPRMYRKDRPAQSRIKPLFSSLADLKRAAALKALYFLYRFYSPQGVSRIACLCRAGDPAPVLAAASLLRQALPGAAVAVCQPSEVSDLRKADAVLEFFPAGMEEDGARRSAEALDGPSPFPRWQTISLAGGVEFGPRLAQRACVFGLHFLEQGLLFKPSDSRCSLEEFEDRSLSLILFGGGPMEAYRISKRFFYARLFSQTGVYVYLHALLKSLEADAKHIDLFCPDQEALSLYFSLRLDAGLRVFEKDYGVGSMILCIGSHQAKADLGKGGKILRIVCTGMPSERDAQALLSLSEDFTACRGDQTFSDAASRGKGFFCDPFGISRYLLKDLNALAENRLSSSRSLIAMLRLLMRLGEWEEEDPCAEWVDEGALQHDEPLNLLALAEAIGGHLQDPDAIAGFKRLHRILLEEHSANDCLVHLVKRSLCHQKFPHIERLDWEELEKFASGKQPFSHLAQNLSAALLF